MKKRVIKLVFVGVLTLTLAQTYARMGGPSRAYCDGWWGDCKITIGNTTIEGDGSPVVIYE